MPCQSDHAMQSVPQCKHVGSGLGFGLRTCAHAPGWARGRWRAMRLRQPCARSWTRRRSAQPTQTLAWLGAP